MKVRIRYLGLIDFRIKKVTSYYTHHVLQNQFHILFIYQYILFVLEIHREEEIEPLLGDGKPDNKSTDGHGQQIITSSESIEGQLPSTSLKEDNDMIVQGMDAKHKSKL